jgi:N-acetylglutamate synthase
VTGVRYRLEVRLTPADVGQRVVIRWRRPGPGDGEQIADVLGVLEENDSTSFAVRTSDGALVVIPAARALAGKVVPLAPQNRRRVGPLLSDSAAVAHNERGAAPRGRSSLMWGSW